MNAPDDNTAAKGLRGWWASPRRPGMQRLIVPYEYRHLRFFGAGRIAGGSVAATARRRVPLVRRLRMGSLLPGSWDARSRGWLLVPHCRSLRICLNLSRASTRRGDDAVLADLPGRSRREIPSGLWRARYLDWEVLT